MSIKELRLQTGLSQSKFAGMFDIPIATLKDWEQERRTPPGYVVGMMKTILEYKGLLMEEAYIEACEARRKSVERAMTIILSATDGPNQEFMEALESYIFGKISLTELEAGIERLEYLGV